MIIKAFARLDNVGAQDNWEVEIPDEELEGLDAIQRYQMIEFEVKCSLWDHLEWGWDDTE